TFSPCGEPADFSRRLFSLVRFDGTFSAEVATSELESGQSPWCPLFAQAQEVVTVARRLHESRTSGG
ncbi:MAG TPA: hypothetical protein PKY05_14060, partial [Fibrobacteria bacterium]|nr:hypothetical protein [Fibrobacteria bacterium]